MIDTMIEAYIDAALWSSDDDEGFPLDAGLYELAPSTRAKMRDACVDFKIAAGPLLDGWTDVQAGHDLWLTRCGHGAGFWDRNMPHGDELTALVGHGTKFPNVDLYIGDDTLIYAM